MTEKIHDKVKDLTTINFSITKCPHKVYEEFVSFCKEETNNNYSMGMKMLLDAMKVNIKEITLFERYMELKERIEKLEEGKSAPEKEPEEKAKTFGKKKK